MASQSRLWSVLIKNFALCHSFMKPIAMVMNVVKVSCRTLQIDVLTDSWVFLSTRLCEERASVEQSLEAATTSGSVTSSVPLAHHDGGNPFQG